MGLLGNAGSVTEGQIDYSGSDLTLLSSEELRSVRGAEIGMVFQDCLSALTPIATIENQVYEELSVHKTGDLSRNEVVLRTSALLKDLSIAEPERVLASYPFELSGGIGQRVGIAMAMLLEPKIILADEPTSALDVVAQKQVLSEFERLRRDKGTAIVLVTHNIAAVRAIADSVIVLKEGSIVEAGTVSSVLSSPRNAYTQELLSTVPSLRRRGRR